MNGYYRKNGQDWIDKDPDASLDYSRDLTEWLEDVADQLATLEVAWAGVTVDSYTTVGNWLVAWVSGGTVGEEAYITFRWTTVAGRIDERTTWFNIVQR